MSADNRERYLDEATPPEDPEVARLEGLLGRYRHRPEPLSLPDEPQPGWIVSPRVIQWGIATAAVFVAVLLGVRFTRGGGTGGYLVRHVGGVERLARGAWLETGEDEVAWIEVADIGEVELFPGARVRLEDDGVEKHRLYLERGTLHASIRASAEPRLFQVGTPRGISIDLGCEYRLEVDEESDVSRLAVTYGCVSFAEEGRTVFVREGFRCESVPGRGPNAPIDLSLPAPDRDLVRRVEFAANPTADDLMRIRKLHAPLTLFHLLRARSRALRECALEALLEFKPLPASRRWSEEELLESEEVWRELYWAQSWF